VVSELSWAGPRRSIVYPALIGFGLGVLAACVEAPPRPPPQKVAVEPPQPPPLPLHRRAFPVPERKPAPPPEIAATASQVSDETTLAMRGPQPSAPPTEGFGPMPHARDLVGLDQSAARRLFGNATEKSEAPPATIWRYRSATCELELFFYLDLRSGKMRTLHYAFKGEAADPERRQDCLRSLVVARGS